METQWRSSAIRLPQSHTTKQACVFLFEENTQQDTELHIIWDAYKATMRGTLMELNKRHKNKKCKITRNKMLEEKEAELKWRPGKKNCWNRSRGSRTSMTV